MSQSLVREGYCGDNLVISANITAGNSKPAVYQLKRWIVEENTGTVKNALEVYKNKSSPSYDKRVWITDKQTGQRRLLLDYASSDNSTNTIVFSQGEDFICYIGVTPSGQNMAYGINLLSDKRYSLGQADDFDMVHCPGNKDYLVVNQGQNNAVYLIASGSAEKIDPAINILDPVDIEKNLCR